jgi:hypothetical protein
MARPCRVFGIFKALVVAALCAAIFTGCNRGRASGDSSTSVEDRGRDLLPGVKIVYSANIDGEIEPCGCRSNPTGGIHRRWNLIQQKIPGEKLSIDSGDLFYESNPVPPFLMNQWNYQASVLVKAYNQFGVEVMQPGELDFAAGLEQFEKLRKGAGFKIISANIYKRSDRERLLPPYVILTKGAKKVAIFGLYDETLPLPPELFAKEHLETAKEMVSELRGKADVLIALTHIGLAKDEALAKAEPSIDAIFGAHTQSFLHVPEKIGDTLIFQPSFRGQHIGVYENGENGLYQVDARFDSPPGKETSVDRLLTEARAEIARINKKTETELLKGPAPSLSDAAKFQTFVGCAECHVKQYDFHKKTPHFTAFTTLVKAKQEANLDCLKCHTVGINQPGGWTSVNKLVLNAAEKPVDAASFAKSLPNLPASGLRKTSKAFLNVQCENCHGAGGEHPFSGSVSKNITPTTCFQCHTPERAPNWYKDGKPDMPLIQSKLKSMTCPRGTN